MSKDTIQTTYTASCHCGALSLTFHSFKPLAPRACSCSFCRRHGARYVSDPEGRAIIRSQSGRIAQAYRFGERTADFLFCPTCGVYVVAVTEIEGSLYSVLNLNTFEDSRTDIEAVAMHFDSESSLDRTERRRRVWTPTELTPAGRI